LTGGESGEEYSRVRATIRSFSFATVLVTFASCSGGTTDAPPSPSTPAGSPLSTASPTSSSTALPTISCDKPARIDTPSWVPRDLPLPEGTYASQDFGKRVGYFQAILVMDVTTPQFARFVLRTWPEAGWQLGRGDSEPGEVEDVFTKSPAVGAFKAQDQPCHPPFTLMLVIFTPDSTKLTAPPNTQPRSPIGSPSPTAS
jgi:hypothetical protein